MPSKGKALKNALKGNILPDICSSWP